MSGNVSTIKRWLRGNRNTHKKRNVEFIGNTLYWHGQPVAIKVFEDDGDDKERDDDIFPEDIGLEHEHLIINLVPFLDNMRKLKYAVSFLNDLLSVVFSPCPPTLYVNEHNALVIYRSYIPPHPPIPWDGKWLKIFRNAPLENPEMYMVGGPDREPLSLTWNNLRDIINNMNEDEQDSPIIVHINNQLNETLDVLTFSHYCKPCLEVVYDK